MAKLQLPEGLEPETIIYINDVVKYLKKNNQYKSVDNGALLMLVTSFNTYVKASKQLDREGLTVTTDRNNVVAHPCYAICKTSIANATALLRDFGLSLKSRERLTIMGNETEDSPLLSFLKTEE